MSLEPRSPDRWLYGPVPDLLLGCGGLYAITCLVFSLTGVTTFRGLHPALPALLVVLVSLPHYGATLVRVYDRREDRQGYFLFSVVATALLLFTFGAALFHPYTASILATVYLTWSGWHYTGQNYGIASIFLRRRGLEMSGLERRLLHASFTLSYCVVFLVMHGESTQVGDPHREVRLVVLGIPDLVNRVAVPVVIFACFASTVAWVSMLGRRASHLADLAPALLISATQALWWSIPYAANHFELARGVVPISWDLRSLFFPWIAGAHALQYLWITSFYARASGRWSGQLRYYLAVLTAGSAAWALPALAFAPGRDAFDWNFALLLAATVNIHHFILDGAIWRLRHLKVARVLLSNTGADDTGEVIGGPVRKLVWAIALVGLIGTAHPLVEQFIVMPAESRAQDLPAVAASLDRQAWHGKTKAFSRFKLGMAFARAGKPQAAAAQFELSADMEPRVESIKRLIAHYQGAGDAEGFVRSCDRLFELPSVERTMPTPTPDTFGNAMPAAFSEACVSAARRAHPTPPNAGSRTGGGGQDGGI